MTFRLAFRYVFWAGAAVGLQGIAGAQSDVSTGDGGAPREQVEGTTDHRIYDAAGRVDYIVDLRPEVALAEPRGLLGASHFPAYHRANGVNAVQRLEAAHGIEAHAMTSWSSLSFTAFLTPEQVERLRKDPTVKSIVANAKAHFSFWRLSDNGAVWNDNQVAYSPDKVVSWGTVAVNGSRSASNGTALVYVVDAGVGQHQDLNIVERVNPALGVACGTRPGIAGLTPCTAAQLSNVVSCYTHSTAVAGVVGAAGVGSWGVDPNVKIVSVSTYSETSSSGGCAQAYLTLASIKSALDWVQSDIALHNAAALTSVVNLSINWDSDSDASAVTSDMHALSHPVSGPGALVVQSAGNQYDTACAHAYLNTASNDGVLVVGALNTHGQPVVPLTQGLNSTIKTGFWRDSAPFAHEAGSNYGSCVELWAPGDGIYLPLANPSDAYADQDGNTVYTTYGFGSGTSFAAPHVAGLAAKLIETQAIHSPSSAEAAVRAVSYALGSKDPAGLAIRLATNNGGVPSPSQYPYGELSAYSSTASGSLQEMRVNGFDIDAPYGQLGLILNAPAGLRLAFSSYGTAPYGCTIQRDYTPPLNGSPTTILNNATSLPLTAVQHWGGGSLPWILFSQCFAGTVSVTN